MGRTICAKVLVAPNPSAGLLAPFWDMKLYDFHCNHCEKDFEDLVHDVSDARCPACSGADVTKQLSAFAVGGSSRDSGGGASYGGGGSCGTGSCGTGSCGLN